MGNLLNSFWINFIIIVLFGLLGHVCESRALFEDDKMVTSMVDNKVQISQIRTMRFKRSARNAVFKWDFGVIPYEIDTKLEPITVAKIKAAMSHWEKYTCITFVERNATEHIYYIKFITQTLCGCCSRIGRGGGGQEIEVNCGDGGIAHELGHAIGFIHEHQRPDRDEYIDIMENNFRSGMGTGSLNFVTNFRKYDAVHVNTLGEPYDYHSIMHYGYSDQSKYEFLDQEIRTNGGATWDGRWWTLANISTLLPKIGKSGIRPKIPAIMRLSAGDVRKTNKYYECSGFGCGRTYLDQKAMFTSPEYDVESINRTHNCHWRIKVMHGDRIQLKIRDLDIFKSSDCQSDYLEVRDGYWHKSPLLGRFCGTKVPKFIVSTGNRMIINYVSSHKRHRGFSAYYEASCANDKCAACYRITADKYDEFSAPKYHQRSDEHLSCWLQA